MLSQELNKKIEISILIKMFCKKTLFKRAMQETVSLSLKKSQPINNKLHNFIESDKPYRAPTTTNWKHPIKFNKLLKCFERCEFYWIATKDLTGKTLQESNLQAR